MNNPFFTNHWAHSQYPPRHPYYYYSPSPVYQTQPPTHHPEPVHRYPEPVHLNPVRKPESSAPKVVQIPVQFGNSETVQPVRSVPSRFESAVKIQKAFRGFLVRISVKKIKSIKNEVDEIEKRVGKSDYVELLKKDDKERLKVNEMLMGLLFKLDSIRGFCPTVRDCRKAVIKKAIAMQERVDSLIAANTHETDQIPDDYEENTIEKHQSDDQREDSVEIELENAESEESEEKIEEKPVKIEVENAEDEALKSEESEEDSNEDKMEDEKDEIRPNFMSYKDDMDMNGEEEEEVCDEMKNVDEDLKGNERKGRDEKEILEKLMEENGKMMSLMNQLFERSEMQTQMLNSLTQRVEHLEKAFVCDRMRKKKMKKNRHGAA